MLPVAMLSVWNRFLTCTMLNWMRQWDRLAQGKQFRQQSTACLWLSVFSNKHTTEFEHFITALHAMETRCSDENSVRPSVRLPVKRVHCNKTEERSVQIFIPYERSFSLVFLGEEWLVGAPEISGQPAPVGAKSPTFNRYSLVAPQP